MKITYPQAVSGFRYGYSRVTIPNMIHDEGKERYTPVEAQRRIQDLVCGYIEEWVKPPICIPLSGGVDSTYMLLAAMQCFRAEQISCVGVGFDAFDGYNETGVAEAICRQLGVRFTRRIITLGAFDDVVGKISLKNYKWWFFSSSLVPTYYAIEAARARGNVLTGDGGDEMFCGYDRYKAMKYFERFPGWITKRLSTHKSDRRGRKFNEMLKHGYRGLVGIWSERDLKRLFGVPFLPDRDVYTQGIKRTPKTSNIMKRCMWADIYTELFGVEYQKVQTASAMVGGGGGIYSPFMATSKIGDYMAIPIGHKYHRGKTKWCLRRAIDKVFPEYKKIGPKRKQGFAAPVAWWIRTRPLNDFMVGDAVLNDRKIKDLYMRHQDGQDYGEQLWGVLVWKELLKKGMLEVE